MASALYDKGREGFLTGSISWSGDNIKAVLINTSNYTVNLATDQYYSIIAANTRVAVSGNLTSKTTAAGVADADDVTFSTVSGAQSSAIVLFKDTGVESTSPLIAYIDSATGLPVTPGGGDITISWSNLSSRIFKL
jgi:hypothetical protein